MNPHRDPDLHRSDGFFLRVQFYGELARTVAETDDQRLRTYRYAVWYRVLRRHFSYGGFFHFSTVQHSAAHTIGGVGLHGTHNACCCRFPARTPVFQVNQLQIVCTVLCTYCSLLMHPSRHMGSRGHLLELTQHCARPWWQKILGCL